MSPPIKILRSLLALALSVSMTHEVIKCRIKIYFLVLQANPGTALKDCASVLNLQNTFSATPLEWVLTEQIHDNKVYVSYHFPLRSGQDLLLDSPQVKQQSAEQESHVTCPSSDCFFKVLLLPWCPFNPFKPGSPWGPLGPSVHLPGSPFCPGGPGRPGSPAKESKYIFKGQNPRS